VYVSVDNAGEHDGVCTDRDLLRGQGIRIDGEQRCDDPVAHTDGSGPLATARNDPLRADQEVQRSVVQGATMYPQCRSPQPAMVSWRPSRRRVYVH
jgi:hypothetical protein